MLVPLEGTRYTDERDGDRTRRDIYGFSGARRDSFCPRSARRAGLRRVCVRSSDLCLVSVVRNAAQALCLVT